MSSSSLKILLPWAWLKVIIVPLTKSLFQTYFFPITSFSCLSYSNKSLNSMAPSIHWSYHLCIIHNFIHVFTFFLFSWHSMISHFYHFRAYILNSFAPISFHHSWPTYSNHCYIKFSVYSALSPEYMNMSKKNSQLAIGLILNVRSPSEVVLEIIQYFFYSINIEHLYLPHSFLWPFLFSPVENKRELSYLPTPICAIYPVFLFKIMGMSLASPCVHAHML